MGAVLGEHELDAAAPANLQHHATPHGLHHAAALGPLAHEGALVDEAHQGFHGHGIAVQPVALAATKSSTSAPTPAARQASMAS